MSNDVRTSASDQSALTSAPAAPRRGPRKPPREPQPGECCGTGCPRCVWDIYYDSLDAYEREQAAAGEASGNDGDGAAEAAAAETDDTEAVPPANVSYTGSVVVKYLDGPPDEVCTLQQEKLMHETRLAALVRQRDALLATVAARGGDAGDDADHAALLAVQSAVAAEVCHLKHVDNALLWWQVPRLRDDGYVRVSAAVQLDPMANMGAPTTPASEVQGGGSGSVGGIHVFQLLLDDEPMQPTTYYAARPIGDLREGGSSLPSPAPGDHVEVLVPNDFPCEYSYTAGARGPPAAVADTVCELLGVNADAWVALSRSPFIAPPPSATTAGPGGDPQWGGRNPGVDGDVGNYFRGRPIRDASPDAKLGGDASRTDRHGDPTFPYWLTNRNHHLSAIPLGTNPTGVGHVPRSSGGSDLSQAMGAKGIVQLRTLFSHWIDMSSASYLFSPAFLTCLCCCFRQQHRRPLERVMEPPASFAAHVSAVREQVRTEASAGGESITVGAMWRELVVAQAYATMLEQRSAFTLLLYLSVVQLRDEWREAQATATAVKLALDQRVLAALLAAPPRGAGPNGCCGCCGCCETPPTAYHHDLTYARLARVALRSVVGRVAEPAATHARCYPSLPDILYVFLRPPVVAKRHTASSPPSVPAAVAGPAWGRIDFSATFAGYCAPPPSPHSPVSASQVDVAESVTGAVAWGAALGGAGLKLPLARLLEVTGPLLPRKFSIADFQYLRGTNCHAPLQEPNAVGDGDAPVTPPPSPPLTAWSYELTCLLTEPPAAVGAPGEPRPVVAVAAAALELCLRDVRTPVDAPSPTSNTARFGGDVYGTSVRHSAAEVEANVAAVLSELLLDAARRRNTAAVATGQPATSGVPPVFVGHVSRALCGLPRGPVAGDGSGGAVGGTMASGYVARPFAAMVPWRGEGDGWTLPHPEAPPPWISPSVAASVATPPPPCDAASARGANGHGTQLALRPMCPSLYVSLRSARTSKFAHQFAAAMATSTLHRLSGAGMDLLGAPQGLMAPPSPLPRDGGVAGAVGAVMDAYAFATSWAPQRFGPRAHTHAMIGAQSLPACSLGSMAHSTTVWSWSPPPKPPGTRLILFAAGTGIAPLIAMLRRCVRLYTASAGAASAWHCAPPSHGGESPRPRQEALQRAIDGLPSFWLVYGARTREELVYHSEIVALITKTTNLTPSTGCSSLKLPPLVERYDRVLSRQEEGPGGGGGVRHVTEVLERSAADVRRILLDEDGALFACGPSGMLSHLQSRLANGILSTAGGESGGDGDEEDDSMREQRVRQLVLRGKLVFDEWSEVSAW